MFSRLTNVTIYNLANEAICRNCNGFLVEKKTLNSFDTRLQVTMPRFVPLVAGESYYAVGIRRDGGPVRTEIVRCTVPGHNPVFEGSTIFPETPKDFQAGSDAGSDADMYIQFINYSSSQFNINGHGFVLVAGFGYPTNSPGPVLQSSAGMQAIGATARMAWMAEGPADIFAGWTNNGGTSTFGVWIHFNYQMFRVGPRPIWYVNSFSEKVDRDWHLAGNDPSDPYTWNAANLGYNIVATPSSGANSLSIDVVITDITG